MMGSHNMSQAALGTKKGQHGNAVLTIRSFGELFSLSSYLNVCAVCSMCLQNVWSLLEPFLLHCHHSFCVPLLHCLCTEMSVLITASSEDNYRNHRHFGFSCMNPRQHSELQMQQNEQRQRVRVELWPLDVFSADHSCPLAAAQQPASSSDPTSSSAHCSHPAAHHSCPVATTQQPASSSEPTEPSPKRLKLSAAEATQSDEVVVHRVYVPLTFALPTAPA